MYFLLIPTKCKNKKDIPDLIIVLIILFPVLLSQQNLPTFALISISSPFCAG